jgi:hypothetical protein
MVRTAGTATSVPRRPQLQGHIGRVAERSVSLQSAIDHVVQHLRGEKLDQRDVSDGGLDSFGADLPGSV